MADREALVAILVQEIERQDPSIVDLSDGALTRVLVFEPIDLNEMASAIENHWAALES